MITHTHTSFTNLTNSAERMVSYVAKVIVRRKRAFPAEVTSDSVDGFIILFLSFHYFSGLRGEHYFIKRPLHGVTKRETE